MKRSVFLLAALAGPLCFGGVPDLKLPPGQARTNALPPGVRRTVTSQTLQLENGIGCEQGQKVNAAREMISQKKFKEAVEMLDGVIAFFENRYVTTNAACVSFETKADFQRFLTQSGLTNAIWLDWSYKQAYYFKAFVATELNEHEQALRLLDKVLLLSPDDVGALLEKGNIYNITGRPRSGLEQCRKAYDLVKDVDARKAMAARALRGMGYAYVELRRLQEAEDAYRDSLKLDPENRIALEELTFIGALRNKTAPRGGPGKPSGPVTK